MSKTKEDVFRLNNEKRPVFGWVSKGEGWYFLPNDFAQNTAYTSRDFEKFAEKNRRRWNITHYVRAHYND